MKQILTSFKLLVTLWWLVNDTSVMKPTIFQVSLGILAVAVGLAAFGGWTFLLYISGYIILAYVILLVISLFAGAYRNYKTAKKFKEDKKIDVFVIKDQY